MLLAVAAIAVPVGCNASPSATPTASPATPEPPAAPTISEVITPPRPSPATPVRPGSDAVRTQFRPVIEDVPLDTPADTFEPAAETVVLEIHDTGDTVRRVRLGPAIVDRTAIRYTVYRSDDGVEVQFALDPGTDGLDRFNAAAVGCVERGASCPTGRIAYVMNGDLVADPVVAGAPFGDVSVLIADGVMAPAPPGSPFS